MTEFCRNGTPSPRKRRGNSRIQPLIPLRGAQEGAAGCIHPSSLTPRRASPILAGVKYALHLLPLLWLPCLTVGAEAPARTAAEQAVYPWSQAAPPELVRSSVLPNRVMHEQECNWRPALTPIVHELVKNCRTAREAVLALSAGLYKATGVHYSTDRRAPCMNALETLAEKKVSCTGQSIFLVCALRAAGIPARVVGIVTWNHIQGNHTWAEAWFDGAWHMIEYNEQDFNTPWVMENIGMINPNEQAQRILAATPQGRFLFLPSYVMGQQFIPAEDVTERYLALARRWYEQAGLPASRQRVLVDITPRPETAAAVQIEDEAGRIISSALLPTKQDDMRNMARLELPREGRYYLHIEGRERAELPATEAPVQVIEVN